MKPVFAAALLLASTTTGSGSAQDGFDPAMPDLAAIIGCEADIPTYSALVFHLSMEPDAVDTLGWTELESGNPFLRQFDLLRPIEVFGHSASQIVFSAAGPLAILHGVDATTLAASLGAEPAPAAPGQFLAEKVIFEEVEEDEDAGMTFDTRIALNVSTVDTHPGVVLAGCSYRIEIR